MLWKWKKPLRTGVFLHLLREQSHMTLGGPIRTSKARQPLAAGMQGCRDAGCRDARACFFQADTRSQEATGVAGHLRCSREGPKSQL